MHGSVVRKGVWILKDTPRTNIEIEQILTDQNIRYQINFNSRQSFSALPNGLIINVDGERTIVRTTNNSVIRISAGLSYRMSLSIDQAMFEKIANAQELVEFTAMVDERYFSPTTLQGKDLIKFTTQMQRILNNDPKL